MSRTTAHRAVTCAFAWLAVVAVVAGLTAPAGAADVRVTHALFGVHDRTDASYTTIHEGSVRLWSVKAAWQDVETAPGQYDWPPLDHLVNTANAAHASVTMVVAMTPSFYASSPTLPPRDLQHYRDFVRKLMKRYGHQIDSYQVWNEANIANFWTGTPHQMAQLTKAMWQTRNTSDPAAQVVAPPFPVRRPSQLTGVSSYEEQRVGGVPVWRYYDVAAFNLYPLPTYHGRPGVPEDSMALLKQAKQRLHQAGVPPGKPIWNTEVNYGLKSGADAGQPATVISEARQASNVMRTYLLNAANGVRRVFWFRYDTRASLPTPGGGALGNTLLSVPSSPTELSAGRLRVPVGPDVDARTAGRLAQGCAVPEGQARHLHVHGHRRQRHPADLLESVPPGHRASRPGRPEGAGRPRVHLEGEGRLDAERDLQAGDGQALTPRVRRRSGARRS